MGLFRIAERSIYSCLVYSATRAIYSTGIGLDGLRFHSPVDDRPRKIRDRLGGRYWKTIVKQSPPITIPRNEIESRNATEPGKHLPYIAAMFNGALKIHPNAVLLVAGSSTLASTASIKLASSLGVPSNKIQIIPLSMPQYTNQLAVIIDYFPSPVIRKKSYVEFELKMKKFSVDLEVSPDGAYVEEVKVQWAPLKMYIKQQASLGLVDALAAVFGTDEAFHAEHHVGFNDAVVAAVAVVVEVEDIRILAGHAGAVGQEIIAALAVGFGDASAVFGDFGEAQARFHQLQVGVDLLVGHSRFIAAIIRLRTTNTETTPCLGHAKSSSPAPSPAASTRRRCRRICR